ncbi:MAG: aminotransferase class V-fold PLP-dependent enzyme [Bacteroidetes bacterium]|nr:aminotransferase class V-fold PLP-dependent enzyme [Bacteroidota bacterium]
MRYTFAPGPSQLWPGLAEHMTTAAETGLLSMSHRSPRFSELYEDVLQGFREKLGMPAGWSLYFLGSATECWQVLAQGLVTQNALHLYSGAFGERWHAYAKALLPDARGMAFSEQEPIELLQAQVLQPVELLCFTQNETSNGSQVPLSFLSQVRAVLQEQLIALDVTSSLGGQSFDWHSGDVWFASVQKCFGLPAGLGILVCSPRAQARIRKVGKEDTYNGLLRLHKHYEDRQTSYTPNVLNIYLLGRVLAEMPPIAETDAQLAARAARYQAVVEAHPWLSLHVQPLENRSQTTLCVQCPPERLATLKADAQAQGLTLGSGYGSLKASTFRIANFPALPDAAVEALCRFLESESA